MHFYCCNDAVAWLNEAKSRKFPNSPVFCLTATCLPPAIRPGSATCMGPIFLTKNVIGVYNTNPLFQKRFIHCAMVIPFILHWPSLAFIGLHWPHWPSLAFIGLHCSSLKCIIRKKDVNNSWPLLS